MSIVQFQRDGDDGTLLLSHMYFPNDADRRARLFFGLTDSRQKWGAEETPPPPAQKNWTHAWHMQVDDAGWRGNVAGELLFRIALMAEHDEPDAGMNKAVFSLQRNQEILTGLTASTKRDDPVCRRIPLDERSYRSYFSEYRSVAHFWAAYRILEQRVPFFEIWQALQDEHELKTLLAHSAWFLDFGATHKTRNSKASNLLNQAEALTASIAVELKKPSLSEFPESLRKELEGYRAPKLRKK